MTKVSFSTSTRPPVFAGERRPPVARATSRSRCFQARRLTAATAPARRAAGGSAPTRAAGPRRGGRSGSRLDLHVAMRVREHPPPATRRVVELGPALAMILPVKYRLAAVAARREEDGAS